MYSRILLPIKPTYLQPKMLLHVRCNPIIQSTTWVNCNIQLKLYVNENAPKIVLGFLPIGYGKVSILPVVMDTKNYWNLKCRPATLQPFSHRSVLDLTAGKNNWKLPNFMCEFVNCNPLNFDYFLLFLFPVVLLPTWKDKD